MEIKIRRVDNGVIVECKDYYDEMENKTRVFAYDDHEPEGFRDFLHFLDNVIGPTSSKYSEKRIHILIDNGENYEGDNALTKCPLCWREYKEEDY